MDKKQIITIAGRPGSGKSTTAKAVAKELKLKHFSSGDLFRMLAQERNIDVLQANLSAEANAEIDHLVDGKLREIGANDDKLVIDSRTAWHWVPTSFKVFLDLDLVTAADRILNGIEDERLASENIHRDPNEYSRILKRRLDSETRRYKSMYNIDPYDMSNYNLVINTASNDLEQVIRMVTRGYQDWLER